MMMNMMMMLMMMMIIIISIIICHPEERASLEAKLRPATDCGAK